jgi:eukaryotic-like serine/threonine-protein kinase
MITCPSCRAEYEEDQTRYCGKCGSDMSRAPVPDDGVDPMIGRVIDARYRVLSKIGHGGMGAVYKVEHLAMGKQAAMKILHPAFTQDAELAARFRREAEAVSRLSHPNTVQVFDFGQGKGTTYLVMELVRGEDLGVILRRDGPMPFSRTRVILLQVCEALSEAHEAGIIHRDLKPENLLVSRARDGRDLVKVLDFGLAKLRDSEELNQVTARGSLVGTPFYMSPEQIRAEDLDPRADIYSLGALMYRMVTGEHPFTATTPVAVLTQHLTEPLTPPSERRPDLKLAPIVDHIVCRAMAKSRDERFASAEELGRALDEAPHVSQPIPAAAIHDARARRSTDSGTRPTSEGQLKREDIDNYERGLKRKRVIGLMLVPLILLGTAAGVVAWRINHQPAVLVEEREPNNAPKEANLIGRDKTVRGHIGKCISPEESDRDFYTFHVKNAPAVLHVDVSGLPSMDLKLTLFDGTGAKVAEADDSGPGDGEDLPNVRIENAGDYFLSVRELWVAGRPATEDLTNWYTLTARWAQLGPNQESEPDDSPQQTVPLPLDEPMRGFAGRAHDVDYFYPRGDGGGTLSGALTGVDGVDLRLVLLPPGAASGPPGALPAGAKVFDSGGPGAGESFDGIAWPQGGAGPIVVVERKDPKLGPNAHRTQLVGLNNPYTLTVRLVR